MNDRRRPSKLIDTCSLIPISCLTARSLKRGVAFCPRSSSCVQHAMVLARYACCVAAALRSSQFDGNLAHGVASTGSTEWRKRIRQNVAVTAVVVKCRSSDNSSVGQRRKTHVVKLSPEYSSRISFSEFGRFGARRRGQSHFVPRTPQNRDSPQLLIAAHVDRHGFRLSGQPAAPLFLVVVEAGAAGEGDEGIEHGTVAD